MSYLLYKLKFPTGIHIGSESGRLDEALMSMYSDTFYSAIYNEYVKLYSDEEILELTKDNKFLISDLLPYKNTDETLFYIPKPILDVNTKSMEKLETSERKKIKKMEFIPINKLSNYIDFIKKGMDFRSIDTDFGKKVLYPRNKVTRGIEDTEIYNIEIFKFLEESGLYFLINIPEDFIDKFDKVLESLSFSGIGGKKSVGYGSFEILEKIELKIDDKIFGKYLFNEGSHNILLSTYIPEENNISNLKEEDNYYKLIKRSGFVNNSQYSNTPIKRKQIYMISSGSVLNFKPVGKLVDLNLKGEHSIYRLGKPLVLGVEI